jgi:hypothetical protein
VFSPLHKRILNLKQPKQMLHPHARRVIIAAALFLLEVKDISNHAVSFESTRIGTAPEGWTTTLTGSGDPKWTVENDATAPSKLRVIKQSGRATYPLLLKNDTNIKDEFVEVKFKAVGGSQDRAAGVAGGREMRTIIMWPGPMRLRTISFSTRL